MSPRREDRDNSHGEHPSQFTRLLDVERRLAAELADERRRATALIDAVRFSAAERERRLEDELKSGFPELERQIQIDQDTAISALKSSSREKVRRLEEIDTQVIVDLASGLVDEVLGDT